MTASLGLVAPGSAAAHSLLLESFPAAGDSIRTGASPVTLRFNNRIEKSLSRIRLIDGRGKAHALALATVDGPPDRLTATAPSLPPGPYRLEWRVLSTDGHVVRGGFSFRVVP